GAHFVVRGTTSNLLAVAGSFVDETMDGTETATAPFFDHTFTVRDVAMPSLTVEKAFPTVGAYLRSRGCKVNQCSLTLGGDGELTASLEVKGAAEDKAAEVLDAAAVSHPFARFKNFQAAVAEGGAAVSGRFKEFELTLGFDLDDDTYTIGDEGERGDLGEGVIALSGKLTALFKDTAYLDKALAGTATSLTATLTNGGYRLAFAFQEVKFQRTSPAIEGPKGVKESFTWNAYYSSGAADSSVVVTLRNEIANWEA
ncbi:MAG: phage tail tube protein, partial [Desulfovibrionaceae bacterium]